MPSLSIRENEKHSEEPTLPLCSREQPFAHDSSQKQMRDKCVVTAANKVPVICWSVCQCQCVTVRVCMCQCARLSGHLSSMFILKLCFEQRSKMHWWQINRATKEGCVLIHDYKIHIWYAWSSSLLFYDRLKSQRTKIVRRNTNKVSTNSQSQT